VRIRKAEARDVPAIAQAHVQTWLTTYRGLMPDEILDSQSVERRERWWASVVGREDHALFVAEDNDGAVVGFASGGAERSGDPAFTGELYAIYLLAEHQGRGAGRALARAVAGWLYERGHRSMLVWVLGTNPFRRFYEALGGRPVRTKTEKFGETELEEIGYGWSDLQALLKGPG
jgi:L-amino acid N-acyltransferase YncA